MMNVGCDDGGMIDNEDDAAGDGVVLYPGGRFVRCLNADVGNDGGGAVYFVWLPLPDWSHNDQNLVVAWSLGRLFFSVWTYLIGRTTTKLWS